MNKSNYNTKSIFVALFLLISGISFAEGTKQFMPTSSSVGFLQIYDNNDSSRNFMTFTAPANKRLYIHITDPATEKIYFGFRDSL